jgi:hypothetical protein
VTLDLLDDVFLLHFTFEAAQRVLEGFTLLNSDFRQLSTPPNRSHLDRIVITRFLGQVKRGRALLLPICDFPHSANTSALGVSCARVSKPSFKPSCIWREADRLGLGGSCGQPVMSGEVAVINGLTCLNNCTELLSKPSSLTSTRWLSRSNKLKDSARSSILR